MKLVKGSTNFCVKSPFERFWGGDACGTESARAGGTPQSAARDVSSVPGGVLCPAGPWSGP